MNRNKRHISTLKIGARFAARRTLRAESNSESTGCSEQMIAHEKHPATLIPLRPADEPEPLSFAQERLWFLAPWTLRAPLTTFRSRCGSPGVST